MTFRISKYILNEYKIKDFHPVYVASVCSFCLKKINKKKVIIAVLAEWNDLKISLDKFHFSNCISFCPHRLHRLPNVSFPEILISSVKNIGPKEDICVDDFSEFQWLQ